MRTISIPISGPNICLGLATFPTGLGLHILGPEQIKLSLATLASKFKQKMIQLKCSQINRPFTLSYHYQPVAHVDTLAEGIGPTIHFFLQLKYVIFPINQNKTK